MFASSVPSMLSRLGLCMVIACAILENFAHGVLDTHEADVGNSRQIELPNLSFYGNISKLDGKHDDCKPKHVRPCFCCAAHMFARLTYSQVK